MLRTYLHGYGHRFGFGIRREFFCFGRAFVKAMALAIAGGMAMGRAIAMG